MECAEYTGCFAIGYSKTLRLCTLFGAANDAHQGARVYCQLERNDKNSIDFVKLNC